MKWSFSDEMVRVLAQVQIKTCGAEKKTMSSSSSSSSKQARTDPVPTTLLSVLRCFGDFSVAVVRTLTELLTFNGMVPLVSISKEIYNAKIILFLAPPEWTNDDEVRMMFSGMLRTAESRWKRRIDTSLVETLMLGVNDFNGRHRHKTNVVDGEWMRFLGNIKFPKLNSLNLAWCGNITDASLSEVARRCSKLQTLDLTCCYITDAGMAEVGKCTNLQSLNLWDCQNITDAGMVEVARRCSKLQTLNLSCCRNITDVGMAEVGKCTNLHSLNLEGCFSINDAGMVEVGKCTNLHSLNLTCCFSITDVGMVGVGKCTNLHSLDLGGCTRITDAGMVEVGKCTNLYSLDLGYSRITDAGMTAVGKCTNLRSLDLSGCRRINHRRWYGRISLRLFS